MRRAFAFKPRLRPGRNGADLRKSGSKPLFFRMIDQNVPRGRLPPSAASYLVTELVTELDDESCTES